jgi:hypothetical protein
MSRLPAGFAFALWAAHAQAPADPKAIVRRSLEHESFDMDAPKLPDYTYRIDDEEKHLNADGSVKSTSVETREAMNLYGGHFERVVRKNGQDLPPGKARAEQAKFDKAVEEQRRRFEQWHAEAQAKRDEAIKKAVAQKTACQEQFLKLYDARLAGSESVNGRPAWIVELHPQPGPAPAAACGGDLRVMAKFRIKVWIDQEEHRWARLEAENMAPVAFGKILFRVPAGAAYFWYEQVRHEDGVWLVSRDRVRAYAKVMLAAPYRIDETETYSGYRKYQAESRVLPTDGK